MRGFVMKRQCLAAGVSLALVLACVASSWGQTRLLNPRTFGFDIPPGKLYEVEGERVVTNNEQGEPVVARTHVRIGDHRIVMLPDGELVARKPGMAEPTERPFEPI